MLPLRPLIVLCGFTFVASLPAAEIDRIWLTHGKSTPETVIINWESATPGDAIVEFGESGEMGNRIANGENARLHHVEVPLGKGGLHYRVRTGSDYSAIHYSRGYGDEELRVVVVGDVGFAKADWSSAVIAARPDLLIMAGDHVPALHTGAPVPIETTTAFGELIAKSPALFRSIRILPLLGNHDREIRPRGPKPPPEPVYDIHATAFRTFFALPGEEWRWHFDIPAFAVRFIALDLNHLGDMGTTWQTCHSFAADGPQFGWYRDLLAGSRQSHIITCYNERNGTVRNLEKGEWGRMIGNGSLAVTGFGYFGERAEVEGMPFYNTSVSGTGSKYPDPKSAKFESQDNFLLLRFAKDRGPMVVEMRNLQNEVLDSRKVNPRKGDE